MSALDDILGELRDQFLKISRERLARIETLVATLGESREGDGNYESLIVELRREFHSVAGSGATFGYPAVTTIARDAEKCCEDLIESPAPVAAAQLMTWRDALASIREIITPTGDSEAKHC